MTECGTDAVDPLADSGVGQADRRYGGNAIGQIDLDLDQPGIHAIKDGADGAA